jgi:Holliday junction DNA helicase RuvA
MYDSITGIATYKRKDHVVIENAGIGYKIFCSLQTRNEVKKVNQHTKLYISVEHNEKEISLYGFYTTAERDMFVSLINVPGLGNKIAMLVLSYFTVDFLKSVIEGRKTYELMKVKGIGEKFAVKIIAKIKY